MHYSKTGGTSLRNKELNSNDLQSILYWYNKAFRDDEDDDVEVYQKTLIKIQALAVYAQEEEEWSDKFTRLTIIEKENGEFSICCYEDPQISKSSKHIGLFRTGMIQRGGYEQAKPMIEERSPL